MLTLAAKDGLTDIVKELLKAGANVDLQDKVQTSFLFMLTKLSPRYLSTTISTLCLESKLSSHHSYRKISTSHSEGASEGRE